MILGIVLTMFAFFLFSMVDTSVKWLSAFAYPVLQLAFMRYFAHLIISSGRILQNGFSWDHFRSNHVRLVIIRGLLILGSTVMNFLALKFLPLTLTSTILFSAPIIVCLLSAVLLGEHVGKWRWFAILFGFCGVLIAIRPFDESFHWAALLSLLSAICFALYLLLTRRLAGVVGSDTLQFYSGVVGCTVLLPFAVVYWKTPASLLQWLLLVGIGVLAWAGHELLTRAFRFADASVLTPYNYSFIIYLTIWSVVVFDRFPDIWTIVGAGVVVFSGLLIWACEQLRKQQTVTQ